MKCRIGIYAGATVAIIGILVVCAGIVTVSVLPSILRWKVENAVTLKPDSQLVERWKNPPVIASLQFWLFNVTNPNEIIFQGAKPLLIQKGPYGFRERLRKENITFSSNNTVSFSSVKEYFFSPALSCETCQLEDVFTVPNIPYLTVMKLIRNQAAGKAVLDFLGGLLLSLVGEHPFVSDVSARQLLFEGYDDQIFTMVNKFKPGLLPKKMGLFYGRNGSADGPYEIKAGVDGISKLGSIVSWEGRNDLTGLRWWNPNYTQANMINGTDGGIYPPFVSKSDLLPVFSRDICRSLVLKYMTDVSFGGLRAYRFSPLSDAFDSSVEANHGFCWPSTERYYSDKVQPKLDDGWCLPAGMLDVSRCYTNAQIVVTSPQFLFCPDEVIESVDGLYAPSEEFITHIDIEPTTGTVLSASKKLQLSVEMYADPDRAQVFKNMKPVIVPVVWLNDSIAVDEATRNYIYNNVVVSPYAAKVGSYCAIGAGALIMISGFVAIALLFLMARRRNAVSDEFISGAQQVHSEEPN